MEYLAVSIRSRSDNIHEDDILAAMPVLGTQPKVSVHEPVMNVPVHLGPGREAEGPPLGVPNDTVLPKKNGRNHTPPQVTEKQMPVTPMVCKHKGDLADCLVQPGKNAPVELRLAQLDGRIHQRESIN